MNKDEFFDAFIAVRDHVRNLASSPEKDLLLAVHELWGRKVLTVETVKDIRHLWYVRNTITASPGGYVEISDVSIQTLKRVKVALGI